MTVTNATTLQEALGPKESWTIIFENDLTVEEEIIISGEEMRESSTISDDS